MTKVVYNGCFGGFSISDAALKRYAEIKGVTLYPEKEERFGFTTYWTVPPDQRGPMLKGNAWNTATMKQRQASNEFYRKNTLSERDFERDDPILVQVVEELGEMANGRCAKLLIEDLPKGTLYRISEYDGNESIETRDDVEWKVA